VNQAIPSTTKTISAGHRQISRIISGQATADGAGVRLRRYIGSAELDHIDPFLLLDFFESDDPDDYIAGFPPHPHRGFETVTYLLAGKVRHEDSAGHGGVIESGGIQWMTAGRGIIHSEMPEQEHGRLAGFQLWVNLPATDKMCPPAYHEYSASQIPTEIRDNGSKLRVITGATSTRTIGPVRGVATDPIYLDVTLPPESTLTEPMPEGHTIFIFVIDGELKLSDDEHTSLWLSAKQLGTLSDGTVVCVTASDAGARFLLVAARPLAEPIARYGPFVMNTPHEIEQAITDYNAGRF